MPTTQRETLAESLVRVDAQIKVEHARAAKEREDRTRKLLTQFRGLNDEFAMLKGVLCMAHGFDSFEADGRLVRSVFDTMLIAGRMDEINREVIAQFKAAFPDAEVSVKAASTSESPTGIGHRHT